MPQWYEFETDLVGDRSDEPRLPARQVRSLYSLNRQRLAEPAQHRAWELLLTNADRPRGPRRWFRG